MQISTKEVYAMLNANKDINIIDTRDNFDYQKEHIIKSINIPYDIIPFEIENHIRDKSKYIIIYSYTDILSDNTTEVLYNIGYSNVFSMGSFNKWLYKTNK